MINVKVSDIHRISGMVFFILGAKESYKEIMLKMKNSLPISKVGRLSSKEMILNTQYINILESYKTFCNVEISVDYEKEYSNAYGLGYKIKIVGFDKNISVLFELLKYKLL